MKKKLIIVTAALLILGFAGFMGYRMWYQNTHIFVENAVYKKDTAQLDLRGQEISAAHYEALKAQLPDCEILWDVPFQGQRLPEATTELTIAAMTEEDLAALDYFPDLTAIHAESCTDYPLLMQLRQRYEVAYRVTLNSTSYPWDTESLEFTDADGAELLEMLQYLPELKTIHFIQPQLAAEELLALRARYPEVAITWEKDVFGVTYPDNVKEFDFSGTPLEGVEELESLMAYFPSLEKLILCDCGIDNETMAAFRERARAHYKVVWSVTVGYIDVRTDETTFMPIKHHFSVQNVHMKDFVYCEDMICVDLGHMGIWDTDWIYGMPKLQFLVLADTAVSDITPIGTLKDLIYLELFKSPNITDYSPIVNCTSLQDINVAYTNGDAAVFAQMPWLKNLWVNCTNITPEARQLLSETLTDTHIEFDSGWHMGNGWRDLDNYYVMRDLLEMPYYDWGSKRLTGNK